MTLHFYQGSGFAATGAEPPQGHAPLDWLVWHFTTWANLEGVVAVGSLRCDRTAEGVETVGDVNIKQARMNMPVRLLDDQDYPESVTVGDHVPFYFTPRSPMLYRVLRGGTQYQGGHGGLVMLGMSVRDVVDSQHWWCVSDRNAASPVVQFTRRLDKLDKFIDFDLMKQSMWNKTPDDPDRQTRRAAEFLVLGEVPVTMITHVVASSQNGIQKAASILQDVGGTRQYEVQPSFLYQ